MPRILIIILCYNGVDDTLACLASLRSVTTAHDLLVLDNASQDDTQVRVRAAFPDIPVLDNGDNLGFAAGNNIGLRYALEHGYEYALLLNNDTEVAPDFLEHMLAVAESDPQIGVVGPKIVYHERPDLIWSAGGEIDWRRGICTLRNGAADDPAFGRAADVEFVTGCAFLVKRAVLERAGLLDERFFMYFEETEWCVRITRAGFRIVYAPEALVLHKIPLNARFDKEYLAYYMTRNRLLFLRATRAPLGTWLDALIRQDLRTYLSLVLRPKWRKRAGRTGMRLAWQDFWSGRFGRLRGTL